MISYLVYAMLSPFFYALMNVYDKYVIEHRVKKPLSYVVVDGTAFLLLTVIFGLFLDWSSITTNDLAVPIILGLINGATIWVYYYLIIKADVSHVVGIVYLYPVIVALLAFLFLNEVIHTIGYVGMALALTGTLLLSTRLQNLRPRIIAFLIIEIVAIGFGEFLIKVVTTSIPPLNAVAINAALMASVMVFCGLAVKGIRNHVSGELRNFHVAVLGVCIGYGGAVTIFLAMSGLPATVVSTIAAVQPLFVLVTENIVDRTIGKISKDHRLLPKLGAIMLIVAGVVLIYISEIIR